MGDLGGWRGLFDWSMKYADGTTPTDFSGVDFTPEKMAWLETVMKEYVVDFSKRMEVIQSELSETSTMHEDLSEDRLEESEKLLDELHSVVESIDFARDLHTIGGLPTLLKLMTCRYPTLAWRAADVASTCCQNHITVQQWFQEEGAAPVLAGLMTHDDATVRGKGLLAVSSLTRGNPPALRQFLTGLKGLPLVVAMATEKEHPRNQRKALEMLKYICQQVPPVRITLVLSTSLPATLVEVLKSDDDFMMGSGLGVMMELVDDRDALGLLQQCQGLVDTVAALKSRLSDLSGEDADALREEIEAVGLIANAFEAPAALP